MVGKKVTQQEFLDRSNKVHNYKYDYSSSIYVPGNKIKTEIGCPIHGKFLQFPVLHMRGRGCNKCRSENQRINVEDFIIKARQIHGNKYDYTDIANREYKDPKITIICPLHGKFKQTPWYHLTGKIGCWKCSKSRPLTHDEYINIATEVHDNLYDYSEVKYVNSISKIKIICKIHGIFEQIASNHINGSGCNQCVQSKGEKKVARYLRKNNINYVSQKTFNDCRYKNPLRFDFFFEINDNKFLIEYNGRQHYEVVNFSTNIESNVKVFRDSQINDKIKLEYCKDKNIPLLVIHYQDFKSISLLIDDFIEKNINKIEEFE